MLEEMLGLIQNAGGSMPLEEWVTAVRNAGGRPDLLQRLKRQGLVYTTRTEGQHSVIHLGAKPAPATP
jgi:hypothetical protein